MSERNGQRTLWLTDGGRVIEFWPLSQYKGAKYPNWDGNESNGKPSNGSEHQSLSGDNNGVMPVSPEVFAPSPMDSAIGKPDYTQ